jgi:Tfp pilus assembly protein PilX
MVTLPALETSELISLIMALLGLGGMRTAEKWKGVARNNMK